MRDAYNVIHAADRLERHIERVPESGCWIWTGALQENGYGVSSLRTRTITAHRLSYIAHRGPIPARVCVLHRCDVPCCVNPEHLFLGTNLNNSQDMVRKGRSARGERHPGAKLSVSSVREIRASTKRLATVARQFGVSPDLIKLIRDGRLWRHVQ